MAVKMSQSLKQTQSLMMTPQLQQAIKLLTLTHLEMTNVIANEMVENPMLEEMGGEASSQEIEARENSNKENSVEDFQKPDIVDGGRQDFDWDNYIESYNSNSSSPPSMTNHNGNDEMPNYENMVSRGQTLVEHLEWQLRMESYSERELQLAMEVIYNLDDDGYLTVNFDEIISKYEFDREDAYEILWMIQSLDPVGCGAFDLKDCLMIQAKALPDRSVLVETIIDKYLKDLQGNDYSKIAKELNIERNKIKDAELVILSFNPKPGKIIGADDTHYIVPDIYVHEVGGEFMIKVNDDGVPRLRISNLYKALLAKGSNATEKEQEYVQDKLRSALWLIKSIENRQKTIEKVADAIVKYQPNFFKKGASALRPMILKDIANEIGMHESTVSRVTTNKFMHTPIGTFELKYFFNAGIGGKNGGIDIASESLKLKIKEMIANENPKKPISDQKISDLLSADDVVVARRTVAKYREMMNILPSSKRKAK